MASFKNLKDLEEYLKHNIYEVLQDSMEVESVLQDAMAKAIVDKVYNAYDPKFYARRGIHGGLSDPRNMRVTSVSIENNQVRLTFENLTQGADNLQNEYIGDLIEFGEGYNNKHWNNPSGDWAKPRKFSEETARSLNENPSYLINAIQKGLREKGFKVQ